MAVTPLPVNLPVQAVQVVAQLEDEDGELAQPQLGVEQQPGRDAGHHHPKPGNLPYDSGFKSPARSAM